MKNFFKYANKELIQDIFLRWVFENYEDHELGKVVKKFLKHFFNIDESETISELTTKVQEKYIDLSIYFAIGSKKYVLFIEDKTFSSEHDKQLEKYYETLNKKADETKFLYYKTFYLSEIEKEKIQNINKDKVKWYVFDLDEICEFYREFSKSSNFILNQYVNNVIELKSDLDNKLKPKWDDSIYKWQGYFNNTILEGLPKETKDKCDIIVGKTIRFPYVVMWIYKRGFEDNGNRPYLEIRSRDCFKEKSENKISIKFVNYKPSLDYEKKLNEIIKKLDLDKIFSIKGIKKTRKGKPIIPSQIGVYEKDNIDTDQKFIGEVDKCIKYLLEVIEYFWK